MTLRLYYDDAYRTEFDARVVHSIPGKKGTTGIILDQTCFYPTSGGQPCDHGILDSQPVFDVYEEGGEIVHWIAGKITVPSVHGRIIWPRRFDHMQQHTGQHILSQAFLKLLGAQTVSFHLGEETSTIDLDRATLEANEAEKVEDLANEMVFADRPVLARFVSLEEVAALELRKVPTVEANIRIVEIEGFDRSPCGGTHCARTGEVGPIAIRRWERRGQEIRVEFVCGWRAVHDYRWKTATVNELALAFSVKDRELAAAVLRLIQEATENRRELHRLQEELLAAEANKLLAEAALWNDISIVVRSFQEREPQEVRKLASLLVTGERTIALFGISGKQARLVFARSQDLPIDIAALLKKTCATFGGSGGGQAHIAQGGGFSGDRVSEALEWAYQNLVSV
ncbi:MAG: alanyl-tRNA editing protein [Anaerolineae bacterium]